MADRPSSRSSGHRHGEVSTSGSSDSTRGDRRSREERDRHSRRSDHGPRSSEASGSRDRHHHHHSSSRSRHENNDDDQHRSHRERHRHHRREEDNHRRHRHEHGRSSRHRSRSKSPDAKRRRSHRTSDRKDASPTRIIDEDKRADAMQSLPVDAPEATLGSEAVSNIPTSDSLHLRSHPHPTYSDDPAALPAGAPTGTALKRDEWMLTQPQATEDPVGVIMGSDGRPSNADLRADGVRAEVDLERRGDDDEASRQGPTQQSDQHDFFSSLGQQRVKPPKEQKPDPEQLQVSSRELNAQFAEGRHIDNYESQPKRRVEFGAPGYQWRMMKLRKTFEQAEEEGRSIEEVALERYGDEASFREAQEEKTWLDQKGSATDSRSVAASQLQRQNSRQQSSNSSKTSYMFTDTGSGAGTPNRSGSRQSFRRPGESSAPATPLPNDSSPSMSRQSSSNSTITQASKPATPIPSVFTPTLPRPAAIPQPSKDVSGADGDSAAPTAAVQAAVEASQSRDGLTNPPLNAESLNKLEAKVMKAELMGKPNAPALREKLEREKARASKGGDQGEGYFGQQSGAVQPGGPHAETEVQVLPTLDGRGQLYDVGRSKVSDSDQAPLPPGNRRRKKEPKLETHDPKTGEFMRYNADDDELTLEEMVRQQKFKGGSGVTKDYDQEIANRIATDGAFKEDFDYLDENAERLARKKMRSDALKRQFAVNDFAKTKRALESCRFCFQNEGESPPLARVVASGTRAYLAVPENEPLVEGHSLIVPIQHHLTMLEAEDDTWEEVKNFMKCLLQQAAQKGQGVVFYETVLSLKHQHHTVIEAMPLAHDLIASLHGNFRQELLSVESEWSTHHKIISFSSERPFRRSMVAQLPYFMIQFDHKGERGYGHVIEGNDPTDAFEQESDPYGMSETSRGTGGGKFERYFAAEVIGSLLDLEPRQWRKPRRLDQRRGTELLKRYKADWDAFDWTKMLKDTTSKT